MVAPGPGIDSPRTEYPTESSIDPIDNLNLGSRMDSFRSPGGDELLKATKGRRRTDLTPARQIFGGIAGRGGPSRNEFTPLLKSVQRSNLRARIDNNSGVPPTPAFLKNGKLLMDSPALPHGGSSYGEDTTYETQNETAMAPIPDSSINSTPMAPLPRGKDGVLENDGQMTLREQEKIIDEIKKENFGLKLKIVFMEERLKKLGPEHNEEAIKENIEIKVERATLKAELKRYRKSLGDSEKAIADLREQMMSIQDNKQRGYDDGRRSEERARALQEMAEKLELKEKELEEVLYENDRLREGVDKYKGQVQHMEDEDAEEVERLNKHLEQVEGEKGELEVEMREKDRLLDEREAELEGVEVELKGKDRKIQELKGDTESLKERLQALEQQLQGKQGDRNEQLVKKDEALRKAGQKIRDLEKLVRDLQHNLEDEQAGKSEVLREKESIQTENKKIRNYQKSLEDEKKRLENDIEKLQDEARNRSFAYKGRIEERDIQERSLQGELEQIRQDYDDLHMLHEEKATETQRLKSRLDQMNGDFDSEFQTLQQELDGVRHQKDAVNKSRNELEGKLRKVESELQLVISEKELIERSCDELDIELRKARSSRSELEVELSNIQLNLQRMATEKDLVINSSRSELEKELRKVHLDLQNITAEKDLIYLRHDSLTAESRDLQKQVEKLKSSLQEANSVLQRERQLGVSNEQALKREWEEDKNSLNEELEAIDRELLEKEKQHERAVANWQSEKRQLEVKIRKAETTAEDLKRTIEQLQQAESSIQGKESKLVNALRSENERHKKEEAGLTKQITELQDEIEEMKTALDVKVAEHNAIKEELRVSKKAKKTLEEKVKYLDDEVELLSATLDEEKENADEAIATANAEVETFRLKLHATKLELSRLENQHGKARYEAQAVKGDLEAEAQTQRQLKEDIQDANRRLENVKKERQHLQEQLANASTQTNSLRVTVIEIEAERDELKSQLQQLSHKVDTSKHLDHEKAELRKAKSKIEIDLQRANDERAILEQKANDLEADLQDAIDSAHQQETKLEKQVRELKSQLKSLNGERDSERQASQRNIVHLEARIDELLKLDRQDGGLELELEALRASLSDARKRENNLIQKESASRKTIRELRHQIDQLDRELLDIKNAAALRSPPVRSSPRSGRKSEVEELRHQITTCQEQVRDYRSRVKTLERKNGDQKAAYEQIEVEKSLLDQEIAEIRESNEAMVRKNLEASNTIGGLRKRIHGLERELHGAQLDRHLKNSEDTRTAQQQIAEERKELHEHIKTATLEIEQLQAQMNTRDEEIRLRRKKEKELDAQIRTLRKENSQLDSISQGTAEDLKKATRRYQKAVEKTAQLQIAWDEERKAIKQRVRFSESTNRRENAKTDVEARTLETQIGVAEERHRAEIKGLAKQIRYLRAKVAREAGFRADLSFSKNFFLMQIKLYSACNEANMQLIEQMGIFPDRYIREKRPALRSVVQTIIAAIRMRKLQQTWAESKELKTSLAKSLELTRREASRRTKRSIRV